MPNIAEACRVEDPRIKLDGMPDEACWEKAKKTTNFTQRELDEGKPVTERTEVAVIYTSDKMYIGIWCYDSEPEKITAKHMKRDFPYWTDDNFEIIFDTFLDKKNGYVFVINPNGARSDVQTSNDGQGFNMDWNGVWDAGAVITDEGWFGEMEIPFSTLKFPENDVQEWGVNFERNIRRKKEQAFWQGWSRNYDFEWVSHAGRLTGLSGIYGRENVELKPYVTSGVQSAKGAHPDKLIKIGGDVNYLVTPTLKLNLTINTDFAQVESDRAQINLSRFSISFPEKREFFLEGRENFEFNFYDAANVFYSRRIGLSPDGRQLPIVAGIRMVGKAGRTNIGLLSIHTGQKYDIPSANNSVIRISQDVLEKSNIGMIFTSRTSSGRNNFVYGIDGQYATSEFLGNKNFIANGFITRSSTTGNDGTKDLAFGSFLKFPNDLINIAGGFTAIQKNFQPDLGFIQRPNTSVYYGEFNINPRPAFLPQVNKFQFRPFKFVGFYREGTLEAQTKSFQIRPFGVVFRSGDIINIDIERNYENVENSFEINDGIEIPAQGYWFTRYSAEFQSFEGRNIVFYAWGSAGSFYSGTNTGYYASLQWNANRHLNLSADYSRNNISLKEGRFHTMDIGGRLEYSFNPDISTSFFVQWNNQANKILLNFRLKWIIVPGSDFYLAVNQGSGTWNRRVVMDDMTVLGKFIWRFAI